MSDDYRDDPRWKLSEVDADYWKAEKKPPPETPAGLPVELAQPPTWCSLYVNGRPVATWYRASAD